MCDADRVCRKPYQRVGNTLALIGDRDAEGAAMIPMIPLSGISDLFIVLKRLVSPTGIEPVTR